MKSDRNGKTARDSENNGSTNGKTEGAELREQKKWRERERDIRT